MILFGLSTLQTIACCKSNSSCTAHSNSSRAVSKIKHFRTIMKTEWWTCGRPSEGGQCEIFRKNILLSRPRTMDGRGAEWGERSCRFSGDDQTNMFVTFQVFMIHVWVLNNLSTRHGPMIYGVHLSRAIHPARYLVHHPRVHRGSHPTRRSACRSKFDTHPATLDR